jgi:hypothetical protein
LLLISKNRLKRILVSINFEFISNSIHQQYLLPFFRVCIQKSRKSVTNVAPAVTTESRDASVLKRSADKVPKLLQVPLARTTPETLATAEVVAAAEAAEAAARPVSVGRKRK